MRKNQEKINHRRGAPDGRRVFFRKIKAIKIPGRPDGKKHQCRVSARGNRPEDVKRINRQIKSGQKADLFIEEFIAQQVS